MLPELHGNNTTMSWPIPSPLVITSLVLCHIAVTTGREYLVGIVYFLEYTTHLPTCKSVIASCRLHKLKPARDHYVRKRERAGLMEHLGVATPYVFYP